LFGGNASGAFGAIQIMAGSGSVVEARKGYRTAFDAALGRELHEVIQEEDGQPDARVVGSVDLTQRRKGIDRKYDFRGSQLINVSERLLYQKSTQ